MLLEPSYLIERIDTQADGADDVKEGDGAHAVA